MTNYKLENLEITRTSVMGEHIHGYEFTIEINGVTYESAIFKYPMKWAILNDQFKKEGGLRSSTFKQEKLNAIISYIMNELGLSHDSVKAVEKESKNEAVEECMLCGNTNKEEIECHTFFSDGDGNDTVEENYICKENEGCFKTKPIKNSNVNASSKVSTGGTVTKTIKSKSRNKYYNPNPNKLETGDCVIRAICKATGKEWDTVYKELFEIGFKLKVMPNADESWKEYLIEKGFIYHKITNKKGSKRPTVETFAKANSEGTFILRVANHLVTCENGFFYDLFDSGYCSLYGYWEKPKQ